MGKFCSHGLEAVCSEEFIISWNSEAGCVTKILENGSPSFAISVNFH